MHRAAQRGEDLFEDQAIGFVVFDHQNAGIELDLPRFFRLARLVGRQTPEDGQLPPQHQVAERLAQFAPGPGRARRRLAAGTGKIADKQDWGLEVARGIGQGFDEGIALGDQQGIRHALADGLDDLIAARHPFGLQAGPAQHGQPTVAARPGRGDEPAHNSCAASASSSAACATTGRCRPADR